MNRHYIINPLEGPFAELAGLLSLPKKWKDKEMDVIIRESKNIYFQKLEKEFK